MKEYSIKKAKKSIVLEADQYIAACNFTLIRDDYDKAAHTYLKKKKLVNI